MKYTNIDPEEFNKLKNLENHVVLDVRVGSEAEAGAISGYVLIDYFDSSFKGHIEKLDRSKTYLVYCKSGNRSSKTCNMMQDMGFENLYNLNGGFMAWNTFAEKI